MLHDAEDTLVIDKLRINLRRARSRDERAHFRVCIHVENEGQEFCGRIEIFASEIMPAEKSR